MTNMRDWYYAINGSTSAAIGEQELADLFAAGHLGRRTLVWTDGMQDWEPASNFSAFFKQEQAEEPAPRVEPLALEQEAEPRAVPREHSQDGNPIRPWGRFFARKIDIAFIFMGMGYFAGLTNMQIEESVDTAGYRSVLLMLAFMVFIEPIFLCAFGATPGKLILGIHVHQRGGGPITYFNAFSRTVKVLVRGLGLGFPVISIFCQLHALRYLKRSGITSWDREEGFDIEYMPFGFLRALLTCLVLLFLGLISLAVL